MRMEYLMKTMISLPAKGRVPCLEMSRCDGVDSSIVAFLMQPGGELSECCFKNPYE